MEKVSEKLTKLLLRENLIDDSMQEIYQYGFLRMLEIGSAVLTGFAMCLITGMLKEGLIFCAFFVPLRSYLGGFHLEKYWQCYVMSCLSLLLVLWITRFVYLNIYVSCGLILFFSAGIGLEADRERREQGNRVFALIVWVVLIVLLGIVAICFIMKNESVLVLLSCVVVIVFCGKVADRILSEKV